MILFSQRKWRTIDTTNPGLFFIAAKEFICTERKMGNCFWWVELNLLKKTLYETTTNHSRSLGAGGLMKKPTSLLGAGIAIGVVFGVASSNIGLGIALGLAIGASMSYSQTKENKIDGPP